MTFGLGLAFSSEVCFRGSLRFVVLLSSCGRVARVADFQNDNARSTKQGETMERVALESLNWTLTKGDMSEEAGRSGRKRRIKVLHRYPFASSLARMATIVELTENKVRARERASEKVPAIRNRGHWS